MDKAQCQRAVAAQWHVSRGGGGGAEIGPGRSGGGDTSWHRRRQRRGSPGGGGGGGGEWRNYRRPGKCSSEGAPGRPAADAAGLAEQQLQQDPLQAQQAEQERQQRRQRQLEELQRHQQAIEQATAAAEAEEKRKRDELVANMSLAELARAAEVHAQLAAVGAHTFGTAAASHVAGLVHQGEVQRVADAAIERGERIEQAEADLLMEMSPEELERWHEEQQGMAGL